MSGKPVCKIHKKELKGCKDFVTSSVELLVEGASLKECKRVFDEVWK